MFRLRFTTLAVPLFLGVQACSSADAPDVGASSDSAVEASTDVPARPDVAPSEGGAADVQGADAQDGDGPGADAAVDAGPLTFDLSGMYARDTIRVAFRSGRDYTTAMPPSSCGVAPGGTANFSFNACGADGRGCLQVVGMVPPGSDGGGSVVSLMDRTGNALGAIDVHAAWGPVYGDGTSFVQNLHVAFRGPAAGGIAAATGIPGRSVSADYGDVWLLACPFQ